MKNRGFLADALGVLMVFAVLGPLVGGLAFGLISNMVGVLSERGWTPGLALTTMVLGYLAGLLPALMTGAISVALSLVLKRPVIWTAAVAGVGMLVSIGHLAVFDTYPTSTPGLSDFVLIGLIGGLSALVCARVCLWFRFR